MPRQDPWIAAAKEAQELEEHLAKLSSPRAEAHAQKAIAVELVRIRGELSGLRASVALAAAKMR